MSFVRTLAVWLLGVSSVAGLGRGALAAPASAPGAPETGPYLHELLKRPDFSGAYARILSMRGLPPWVRQGGTSTPSQKVAVAGRPWLLVQSCKPHDCPSEHVHILYEPRSQSIAALFVRDPSAAANAPPDADRTELIWLGAPDGTLKNALLHTLRFTE
ncbi:Inhibitor of vertebrate lysozyme [Pandoraea terrae]|uniref:Inhibitor of vertebrate lysozyme n=1 Tax=Pandoraea terrae TaxID=1537710 RepID=A0A5E4VRB6_9BURK|nr:Ivy family c-type lysozyme inhibitor [Pandoraea terrae]VVE14069.1 Inhibitor of vertebrate lysozyme [Pandoraea terrae]